MASLGGRHRQESTDRVFGYFVHYGQQGEDEAFFFCVVSEPGRGLFGSLERNSLCEGSVRLGPDAAPVELAIRSRVMSYIERTDFGQWKPPSPEWRGWYGPV